MTSHYPVLRYPGNITSSEQAQSGALLGWDEIGRPYEVIDAEFIPDDDHSNVYLQYATPDTLRAHRGQVSARPT